MDRSRVKVILFDLDNTLIDTAGAGRIAIERVNNVLLIHCSFLRKAGAVVLQPNGYVSQKTTSAQLCVSFMILFHQVLPIHFSDNVDCCSSDSRAFYKHGGCATTAQWFIRLCWLAVGPGRKTQMV